MATLEIRKSVKLPESSIIEKLVYDKEKCTLRIQFESGAVYFYKDVPQNIVKGFCKAPSIGSYFVSNIKNKFKATKIENSDIEK